MDRSAVISECGTYRYELGRRWSLGDVVTWIMLNPSTADASADDPTIRRCINFAFAWGYAGILVRNLYALRATDPRALKRHPEPVGPDNDTHLDRCGRFDLVVCAWGAHGGRRGEEVTQRLQRAGVRLTALALTKDGAPRHPLYLRGNLRPVSYSGQGRAA